MLDNIKSPDRYQSRLKFINDDFITNLPLMRKVVELRMKSPDFRKPEHLNLKFFYLLRLIINTTTSKTAIPTHIQPICSGNVDSLLSFISSDRLFSWF